MMASRVRWTMSLVFSCVRPISSEICLTISFLVTATSPRFGPEGRPTIGSNVETAWISVKGSVAGQGGPGQPRIG